MKNFRPATLATLTGLLLISAWPTSPLTFLIFVAWVPLLWIAESPIKRIQFFTHCFAAMLFWNIGTTWWIWNASIGGAIAAIICNALLMCIPLWGYHIFKNKFGNRVGYASFIIFWLCFEYIHLNWQLSWPWLTLGNVFATHTSWIQWYEYTGTSGGSLWVLIVNVLLLILIKKFQNTNPKFQISNNKPRIKYAIIILVVSALPFIISHFINRPISLSTSQPINQSTNQPINQATNIIVIQPNIDPYNEKFANGSTEGQIQKLITLSESKIDTNTRLIIWPETALPVAVIQDEVQQNDYYKPVFDFAARHPQVTLVTGIETFKLYGTEKATNTARQNSTGQYYDAFNAAVAIKNGEPPQFYNKSKLVPGVETLPDFLLWLGAIFEKFGGTAGGYGHDKESAVFKTSNNPYVAAPIICYESIYGEYVASYVRKGATILTILTNDGWWFDTPGHKQHLQYARLRAIETRRWVARSANTGISAVIDDYGNLVETKPWDEAAVIKYNIPASSYQTFFVRNGDLLSRVALALMGVLIMMNIITIIKKRLRKHNNE